MNSVDTVFPKIARLEVLILGTLELELTRRLVKGGKGLRGRKTKPNVRGGKNN